MPKNDLSWMDKGVCSGAPSKERTDIFFGLPKETPATREYREKRAIEFCSDCTIKVDCLYYAADEENEIVGGVWGGLSEKDVQKYKTNTILYKHITLLIRLGNESLDGNYFCDGGDEAGV